MALRFFESCNVLYYNVLRFQTVEDGPDIKLEFGSLSNQEPVESSPIELLLSHDTIVFNDLVIILFSSKPCSCIIGAK